MARESSIWFRESTGWWMTTVNGNQVKLSTDKKEAQKAFHALMAGPIEEAENTAPSARPSFKKIANQYLGYTDKTQAANTFKSRRIYLQLFCNRVKGAKAEDVKPHTLEEWIAVHKEWSLSTATTVRGIVLGCYTWAEAQGYITRNPFRKVKAGKHTRRERILTADEKALVHGRASPPLRDFILMLDQTGCRPFSEAASMTAAMVNFEQGTVTFAKHKNAKKGKTRVVYLPAEAKELLARLAKKHPEGPLLRTKFGKPWRAPAVCDWMRRIEKATGVKRLSPYAWRHTYISTALANGVPASVVATLVGNSTATIEKHYNHLYAMKDTLRAAALKVVS